MSQSIRGEINNAHQRWAYEHFDPDVVMWLIQSQGLYGEHLTGRLIQLGVWKGWTN